MFKDNLDRFFSSLEWRWSLANLLWGTSALLATGLPAWAVWTMNLLSDFAPLSWVGAGFSGFLLFCLGFWVYAQARFRVVRARFASRSLEKGGNANPMEQVFERRRIFLNEFALPSSPFITDKTFVDCEIIGPCNIYLIAGCNVSETKLPNCDAIVLDSESKPFNAYGFIDCTFRRCSFQRVTFILAEQEYENFKHLTWMQWISGVPEQIPVLDAPKGEEQLDAEPQTSPEGQD